MGAECRYTGSYGHTSTVVLDKVRDQLSGHITGMDFVRKPEIDVKNVLIVDDICDGGRTFCEASKLLKKEFGCVVHLYVSHGIFSRGLEPLRKSGIERIFTKNGEVNEV